MLSRLFISTIAFLSFLASFSQDDTSTVYITSPYRTEPSPYFHFSTLERGFPSDSLEHYLNELEQVNKHHWSHEDSLHFAQTTLRIGNLELSEHYFNRLKIDYDTEEDYWWDHLMLHWQTEEFSKALNIISVDQPGVLQNSKVYFIQHMFAAKLAEREDPKHWLEGYSVFNWEIDSLAEYDKRSDSFKAEVIQPILRMDSVLELSIRYIHSDDAVISRSFYEMGLILEHHFSLSQAYIAYSVARQYNKKDKDVTHRLKKIKGEMLKKMYKIPNFRKYFPRIEDHRFDYEVLKEKLLAQQDSSDFQKPVIMKKVEEKEPPIRSEFIFLIGLSAIFLMILFFVKTSKKK